MGYPNWQIASDYKFTVNLLGEEWAWEFLRRNADYRVRYAAFSAQCATLEKKFGIGWRNEFKARNYEPPKLTDDESDEAWALRAKKDGLVPEREWLDKLQGKGFGLDGMFDPLATDSKDVRFLKSAAYPRIKEYVPAFGEEGFDFRSLSNDPFFFPTLNDRSFCHVVFDFEQTLEEQILDLRGRLRNERTKRKLGMPKRLPIQVQLFTRYLRLLDADFEKADKEKIVALLWPPPVADGVDSATEARKQAKNWTKPAMYLRLAPRKPKKPKNK